MLRLGTLSTFCSYRWHHLQFLFHTQCAIPSLTVVDLDNEDTNNHVASCYASSTLLACKRIHHHRNSLYPNYHPRTDLNPSLPAFDRWKTHFYSSTSTSAFIDSFDVLKHAHHFADPFIASLPKHYSPEASSTLRRRILFEASHLCSNLDNYGSFKPFCEPFVYTSSIPSELSIVIDTGASNSITPTLTDFTGPLQSPNISLLGSLTSVKKVQFLGTLKMRMVFAAVSIQLLTTYHQLPLGFSRLRSIQRLIKL